MRNLKEERLGVRGINTYGSEMEIVEYNNSNDIWVKFLERGNLVHTDYKFFRKGEVKNPYDKSVCGVGYIGEGEYKVSENGKQNIQYIMWSSMLKRCYDGKYHKKFPAYVGC